MTTTGDFNGDGRHDLVVGTSGEDLGADKDAGMVTILWGGQGGDVVDDPAGGSHDFFGIALAAGDFDADGVDDLAVGNDSPTVVLYDNGIDTAGNPGAFAYLHTPILRGEGGVN